MLSIHQRCIKSLSTISISGAVVFSVWYEYAISAADELYCGWGWELETSRPIGTPDYELKRSPVMSLEPSINMVLQGNCILLSDAGVKLGMQHGIDARISGNFR